MVASAMADAACCPSTAAEVTRKAVPERKSSRQTSWRVGSKRSHKRIYQAWAVSSTAVLGALTAWATLYRLANRPAPAAGSLPVVEVLCTLGVLWGSMLGMEFWARWAHRVFWHGAAGWLLHKSHHSPRLGLFEANDIFAGINAAPAIALCLYGFLTPTLAGSLCYGAGLGISIYGTLYMFIHDGMVHKRFPVGPIANLPALKRVAAAHRLHHSEKYGGVPWGMFLGPQELEAIGAGPELERLVAQELS